MFEVELVAENPIQKLTPLAETAEKLGFKACWTTDHYNNRNPLVTLTAIAAKTDKIEIGTGITNPYTAHPAWIAGGIASLNEFSDGRARLGIGAGDKNTLENLCITRESPLNDVLNAVNVARELFNGEKSNIENVTSNASLNYQAGDIPIYIGAQGPQMLGMASKYGDGILINASHPRDFKWSINQIGETDAEIVAYTSFSMDQKRDAARKKAREPVSFIASGAPDQVLDRHGIDIQRARKIGQHIKNGDFSDGFNLVSDQMIDSFSISGSPDECRERVEEIFNTGVDIVVIGSPIGPDPEKSLYTAADILDI